MNIRSLNSSDSKFLEELIYHTIFIPHGGEKPDRTIIFNPDVFVYIADYGDESDTGVVATIDDKLVGGAWTRVIDGYGSIDDKTPELAFLIKLKNAAEAAFNPKGNHLNRSGRDSFYFENKFRHQIKRSHHL